MGVPIPNRRIQKTITLRPTVMKDSHRYVNGLYYLEHAAKSPHQYVYMNFSHAIKEKDAVGIWDLEKQDTKTHNDKLYAQHDPQRLTQDKWR